MIIAGDYYRRMDASKQAEGIALPVSVDKTRTNPLPDQLTQEMRRLIAEGTLRSGDAVPSSRRLAKHLGISRGSVETAYGQLAVEGFLVSAERSMTRINPELPSTPERAGPRPFPTPRGGVCATTSTCAPVSAVTTRCGNRRSGALGGSHSTSIRAPSTRSANRTPGGPSPTICV